MQVNFKIIGLIFLFLLPFVFLSAQEQAAIEPRVEVAHNIPPPPSENLLEQNPPPPIGNNTNSRKGTSLLPYAILFTGLVVLLLLFFLIRMGKIPANQALPSFLLIILIFSILFLVMSELSTEQLLLPTGLLGVITGYTLGSIKN